MVSNSRKHIASIRVYAKQIFFIWVLLLVFSFTSSKANSFLQNSVCIMCLMSFAFALKQNFSSFKDFYTYILLYSFILGVVFLLLNSIVFLSIYKMYDIKILYSFFKGIFLSSCCGILIYRLPEKHKANALCYIIIFVTLCCYNL